MGRSPTSDVAPHTERGNTNTAAPKSLKTVILRCAAAQEYGTTDTCFDSLSRGCLSTTDPSLLPSFNLPGRPSATIAHDVTGGRGRPQVRGKGQGAVGRCGKKATRESGMGVGAAGGLAREHPAPPPSSLPLSLLLTRCAAPLGHRFLMDDIRYASFPAPRHSRSWSSPCQKCNRQQLIYFHFKYEQCCNECVVLPT